MIVGNSRCCIRSRNGEIHEPLWRPLSPRNSNQFHPVQRLKWMARICSTTMITGVGVDRMINDHSVAAWSLALY